MNQLILLISHTILCGALGWSAWCRLVKMTASGTYPSILYAFVATAMAASLLAIAPWASWLWQWFPDYQVHPAVVLMLAGFVAVQVSTSRHWKHGTPPSFIKEQS